MAATSDLDVDLLARLVSLCRSEFKQVCGGEIPKIWVVVVHQVFGYCFVEHTFAFLSLKFMSEAVRSGCPWSGPPVRLSDGEKLLVVDVPERPTGVVFAEELKVGEQLPKTDRAHLLPADVREKWRSGLRRKQLLERLEIRRRFTCFEELTELRLGK